METLIIIPITMHNFSFSAPVSWLFSRNADSVKGIFGFELNIDLIKKYQSFIIELNWFIELKEFGIIVKNIKKHNRKAKILFGGLFASLKYKEIMAKFDVDYHIRGDNELPMHLYLNGEKPEGIPNMTGRNFANDISYRFEESEFGSLSFDLDWFPSYGRFLSLGEEYYEDTRYNHLYHLPMIITAKGGCENLKQAHQGCVDCMGAKSEVLQDIYNRPPVTMSRESLIATIRNAERKFDSISLYIMPNTPCDISDQYFDLYANIEIDTDLSLEGIKKIAFAFRESLTIVPIHIQKAGNQKTNLDYHELIKSQDHHHRFLFFVTEDENKSLQIPAENRLYTEDVFPDWAKWDYYQNYENAYVFSSIFYHKVKEDVKSFPL